MTKPNRRRAVLRPFSKFPKSVTKFFTLPASMRTRDAAPRQKYYICARWQFGKKSSGRIIRTWPRDLKASPRSIAIADESQSRKLCWSAH
jgi:hypothetical protein